MKNRTRLNQHLRARDLIEILRAHTPATSVRDSVIVLPYEKPRRFFPVTRVGKAAAPVAISDVQRLGGVCVKSTVHTRALLDRLEATGATIKL